MTAPVEAFIQLPIDSGNAGKQLRTISQSIGGEDVHEQFIVPVHALTITGNYWFSSTQQSVSASAHNGTSTGFFWLQNPLASTISAFIRNISIDCNTSSTTPAPTAPVITISKMTFTGVASGTAITPISYLTGAAANQAIMRSAMTGMTISLVNPIGQFSVPSILTGVGNVYAYRKILEEGPQSFTRTGFIELHPGEGLAIWQSVAGTTSDPRRFIIDVSWLEVDLT